MQKENQAAQELDQDFSTPWDRSDVVLLVEEQQFHVHRVILEMSSPVFSRMFSADFKEKDADEIPLPEKKAVEIREMLLVIYPRFCKRVNDINLHFLLPLAREYQMAILTEKCEDYLLRKMEKKNEIGPVLEIIIVAQTYSLERVKTECINKTQKLNIEVLRSHELYEQVEPRCQRKMIELQMSNMEKKLRDSKAELIDSKAEISRLQGKIREMKDLACNGLQNFESVVSTLGSHIRHAKQISPSVFTGFIPNTEQNLATIRTDTSGNENRKLVCSLLHSTYEPLNSIHNNLKAIQSSTD